MTYHSQARVGTDRPHRYAKQLAAHLGRRIETAWDQESGQGRLVFPNGTGTLTAVDGALLLRVESNAREELASLEDVIARHLVRFGAKDELVVPWRRESAPTPTTQRTPSDTTDGHIEQAVE
ncbi:DUF2218 domain-containing protein [Streptomyces luteolus]|uniref:DUF2218 domain-containing protein n=1 Tax=Streptomyces luteolus TaxID=3043615 RepID=A0ABT6T874_9ACTN|nr:DUF2218 domain-containing protein [Streptomyces sp. B-S-A12]MDI3424098.1 DUF2218 domain-containing protein [Streptomyces sp. B-S-A12]